MLVTLDQRHTRPFVSTATFEDFGRRTRRLQCVSSKTPQMTDLSPETGCERVGHSRC